MFGLQRHALPDTINKSKKKHKIETTIYTFSILSQSLYNMRKSRASSW